MKLKPGRDPTQNASDLHALHFEGESERLCYCDALRLMARSRIGDNPGQG
jgi:hypothetical protein